MASVLWPLLAHLMGWPGHGPVDWFIEGIGDYWTQCLIPLPKTTFWGFVCASVAICSKQKKLKKTSGSRCSVLDSSGDLKALASSLEDEEEPSTPAVGLLSLELRPSRSQGFILSGITRPPLSAAPPPPPAKSQIHHCYQCPAVCEWDFFPNPCPSHSPSHYLTQERQLLNIRSTSCDFRVGIH